MLCGLALLGDLFGLDAARDVERDDYGKRPRERGLLARLEELDALRLVVLVDDEVLLLEVADEIPVLIRDGRVNNDEVGLQLDRVVALRGSGGDDHQSGRDKGYDAIREFKLRRQRHNKLRLRAQGLSQLATNSSNKVTTRPSAVTI
jgi:hypothetical protein